MKTTFDSAQLYQWTEFNTSGMYFEEIRFMKQIEFVWKLVTELDVERLKYQQPGLCKEYRRMLRKIYRKCPTYVPKRHENNPKE